MRIVEQAPDRLILHDSPWGLRGLGALFALGGSGIVYAMIAGRHAAEHNAWVGFLVGTTFALVGVAALLTAADRRVIFDGPGKLVRTIRRGLLGSTTMEYPFASIRDIALEASGMVGSNGANTNPMYRIVFVLRDGTRAPWTSVLTGDIGNQAQCVAAAREFGGWDTSSASTPASALGAAAGATPASRGEPRRPTPLPVSAVLTAPWGASAAGPSDSGAAPTKSGRNQNLKLVGCFLAIFMLVGAGMTVVQTERLLEWRPVPALVISSTVESVHGDKGSISYRPAVIYNYVVGGRTYQSGSVSILLESRSYAWATRISEQYPPGATVTAYIDPGNPGRAFLLHHMSFIPFVVMGIPVLFGAIVFYSTRWSTRQADLAASVSVPVLPQGNAMPTRAA